MPINDCLKGGLQPYQPSASKPWNERRIHHLYNKLSNGAPVQLINAAKSNSPSVIIDFLLNNAATHPLPGEKKSGGTVTWDYTYPWSAEKTIDADGNITYYKYLVLVQQWLNGMIREGIKHKLVLFWSNHFVAESGTYGHYPSWVFQYYYLLHKNAMGNFKTFVEDMGRTPAMLHYLDGRLNIKNRPNENYARELLELFTMGVGNYTEQDVKEIARALTGWQLRYSSTDLYPVEVGQFLFSSGNHDFGNKRVLGQSFTPQDSSQLDKGDYKLVHNIIFNQRKNEIAKFICTKLYRFYMYQYPPPEIIDGLAQIFIQSNWEIMPVLKALFKSEHFFEDENMGVNIKSNIDNFIHYFRSLDLKPDEDYFFFDWQRKTAAANNLNRDALGSIYNQCANLGQTLFNPVNVAGWQGHRAWLSEFVLVNRWRYSRDHVDYHLPYNATKEKYRNFLKMLAGQSLDPNQIVTKVMEYFITLPMPLDIIETAVSVFKAGVPANYFEDGTWDLDYVTVPTQFANLMKYITTLPEYQLL
ncbi:MAG: DUF1800 domain-containing protein [Saprospiraceae bacterium]|nr:DUF1800 domain-containing protein [Saprospiraceae bacterium]